MIPVIPTPPTNGVTPNPDMMVNRALDQTVQAPPQTTRDGITNGAAWGWGAETYQRSALLPLRGTRQREYALRRLYFMEEMGMIKGAFSGVAKAIASLGWEVKGDDTPDDAYGRMAQSRGWMLRKNNGVEYYQEMFRQANFGQGWGTLCTQLVTDFLRYDAGAYVEVIASGDSYNAPIGPVAGIAHLDPMRTYPTGDPRYPAVYYDRYGGIHVMHHSRVMRFVDMDDGDEMIPGYGDSALSRAVAIALRQIHETRYINARLDDKPAPGVDIWKGVSKGEFDAVNARYKGMQSNDAMPTFGKRLQYFSMDPQYDAKIESYDFSTAPESFDFRVYTEIDIDMLALVMGIDRQELWQLTGGNIGSGQQSFVLQQKSKGKLIGFLLQQIERALNGILPDGYTFEFKARDTQESLEDAQIAQAWGAAVASMSTALSPDEQRTLLSSQIEAVRDAINDAPRANDVYNQPYTAQDDAPGAAPVAPASNAPNVNINDDVEEEIKSVVKKDYGTTQAMFIQDVHDLLLAAINPDTYLNKRSFGVTLRSLLKNYGTQAYRDGLAQGGVYVQTLDTEDVNAVNRIFMGQAQYVGGLAEAVFTGKEITPANAHTRAMMWGKSLQEFANGGVLSADANGMFLWRVNILKEHCPTCLRMNGQVHRFKTYVERGILPKSTRLKCGGWLCGCELVKTTEMARGRFF